MSSDEEFRKIYISPINSNFIYNTVRSRLVELYGEDSIVHNEDSFKMTLIELQHFIFDNFMNKLKRDHNNDSRTILMHINKITITQLEYVLNQSLQQIRSSNDTTVQIYEEPTNNQFLTNEIQSTQSNKPLIQSTQSNDVINVQVTHKACQTDDFDIQPSLQHQQPDVHNNISQTLVSFDSKESLFNTGQYRFPLTKTIRKLVNIKLHSWSFQWNKYNINETNNKFFIAEGTVGAEITLPIGYYNFESILQLITTALNNEKKLQNTYRIYRDSAKGRVYISSDSVFRIEFPDNGINKLLGFNQNSYIGNNIYISEHFPRISSMEKVYLRLYINDNIIPLFVSHNNKWFYFHSTDIDSDKCFGQVFCAVETGLSFTFDNPTDASVLTFELYDSDKKPITKYTDCEIVVRMECDN